MASYTKRVAYNTVVQVIGKIITTAISVVMLAYLARYLGVSGYGDYTTVFAFIGFFSIIADMGFVTIAVREMAKKPDDAPTIIGNIFSVRVLFAFAVILLAPIAGYLVPAYSAVIKTSILIGAPFAFFVLCNQIFVSIFQVKLKMGKSVVSDIVGRSILLIIMLWLIQARLTLEYFVFANVVSNIVVCLVSYLMARKFFRISFKFDFNYWKYIIREAIPLGIIIVLGMIYFRIDTVMLSIMKDSEAVGIYGAPYKILEILVTIPPMFMGSVFPLVTKYLKDGDPRFNISFLTSFDFMSIIILPILVGVLLLAKPIIMLVVGSEFVSSVVVLQYLIFAVFIIFFGSIFNYFILASNLQKKLVWVYILSVFINIIGNLILIPRYSYMGSSMVTIFTEAFVCAAAYLILYINLGLVPKFSVFAKSLVAALLMGAVIYFFINLNLFILIFLGGVVYFTALYIMGGIKKETLLRLAK